MATRRQRETADPRVAANAGPRNQTAAAAARSAPRNQTAAAAATPSGPRNQTVATAVAATGRPHARNGRALGGIGNHMNTPVVHGEANRRRRLTRSLSAQPNVVANTIPPACPAAAVEGASASRVGRAESGENNKLSTELLKYRDFFMEMADALGHQQEKFAGDFERLTAKFESEKAQKDAEIQRLMEELESEKAQKEAEVQKVEELESKKAQKEVEVQKLMEENVKLRAMLDKKEAQLQAMSEQCKFMALNHRN